MRDDVLCEALVTSTTDEFYDMIRSCHKWQINNFKMKSLAKKLKAEVEKKGLNCADSTIQ
jgi:hypothetical protein